MQRRSKQTDGNQAKRAKQTNGNHGNNNRTTKFISQEEATEQFYLQQQNHTIHPQQHDRIARTSSQGRHRDESNIFRGQNGEKFKTLNGDQEQEKVHRSREIKKTQQQQQQQQQQHVRGEEEKIKYRTHRGAHARPKSEIYQRPKSGEFHYRPKSGEYQQVRRAGGGHQYIERTSSSPSKQQQQKEKYHCDICRKLNKNKADGEPTRYCWERYYAVSSSTPLPGVQSFQDEF